MRRILGAAGLALGTLLFDIAYAGAQSADLVAEGRTIGHLLIATVIGASITLSYIVATHVRPRRRTSRHV